MDSFDSTPPQSPLPFNVGDVIAEKYRVESILGEGGMGIVVRATHLDLDRPVAVKVIRRELANHEQSARRLMFEARAAAKIRSEHAGKVLDVGRLVTGEPYIVMEFLEGYDLAAHLRKRGRLPASQAIDLLIQACDALVQAHDAKIVHRDLKPENLFLSPLPDGTHFVKVLDFGISKDLSAATDRALTAPQTAIGSPQYMAPEQMEAQAVDPRADVWALGTILYEMLSGLPAFDGDTVAAVYVQVLTATPKPLRELVPELNSELARAVEQCLQKSRDARPKDVRTLVALLAPFGGPHSRMLERRILGNTASDLAAPALSAVSPDFGQMGTLAVSPNLKPEAPSATGGTLPFAPEAKAVNPTLEAPTSRTVPTARSQSRTPVFLSLLGICALGPLMFWLARGNPMHTRSPGEELGPKPSNGELQANSALPAASPAQASAAALPEVKAPGSPGFASPALSSGAQTAPSGNDVRAAAGAKPALSSEALSTEIAATSGSLPEVPRPLNRAPRATTLPRSAAPGPANTSKANARPATEAAWNPDSFGGRQ